MSKVHSSSVPTLVYSTGAKLYVQSLLGVKDKLARLSEVCDV
jgi:hypothetical protein